ncbi:unnamed protein product [Toxocara canis]|uniref:Uncharacterized protein n=1 Tax=Toxocara canis TaxID=6265 RepID=A0A183UFE0_TOXCA|nr:unnamed protein product [Toxocara canis]
MRLRNNEERQELQLIHFTCEPVKAFNDQELSYDLFGTVIRQRSNKDPGSVENGNEASAYQLSRPQMTLFMDPAVSGQHDCVRRLVGSPDFFSTSGGRITPSEMIHNYGLERSLSATYSDKAILDLLPGSTAPAGSPQVLKAYPQRAAAIRYVTAALYRQRQALRLQHCAIR